MASPLNLTFGSQADSSKIGKYKVISNRNVASLFGRYEDDKGKLWSSAQFSPYPIGYDEPTKENNYTNNVNRLSSAQDIHNDEVNDISIASIVKYTSGTDNGAMRLNFADFAYLKNVGVYPNNRLVVARRFAQGVQDDLTKVKSAPLSTLVSWVPDENFIDVSFGEKWEAADASFKEILNSMGKEMKASAEQGSAVGSALAGGLTVLPFPGFMEGIQYSVLKELGLTTAGIGNSPLGNPNLIREAKRRSVMDAESPGSGLTAKFSIKMVVEYEQKFINGVDPTLVYLDIIQNALTFGTSDAAFQFNSNFANGSSSIISKLIKGDVASVASALIDFVAAILKVVGQAASTLVENLINPPKNDEKPDANKIANLLKNAFAATAGHVVSKYKVKLIGVVNALTGTPSAPWHVMIGNPKKPIFTSGDMLCESVDLTVGKTLAFNDLPSYIKLEFTLTNARSLGASEIFNKFNTGRARTYKRINQSYVESQDIDLQVSKETGASASEAQSNLDKLGGATPSTSTSNENVYQASNTEDYLLPMTINTGDDWLSGKSYNTDPVVVGEGASNNVTTKSSAPSSAGSTSTTDVQTNPPPSNPPNPPTPNDPASQATASSKKGYKYNINVVGPKRNVVVTNNVGVVVTIMPPSFTATDADLIGEAKQAVGDV